MNDEVRERELREALDDVYRPAPALLARSMAAVRGAKRGRSPLWALDLAVVVLVVAALGAALALREAAPGPAARADALPRPIPQPVTRTSPAAQIAWLRVQAVAGQPQDVVGVGPDGRVVARLARASDAGAVVDFWRSGDEGRILAVGDRAIAVYSALDGSLERAYAPPPGRVTDHAFSPDGRWLALLLAPPDVGIELLDLETGASRTLPVGHDPNARLPGMSGETSRVLWGTVVFAPDSLHLYALTDWGGPARLTAFQIEGDAPRETATAVSGRSGRDFPACDGPAAVAHVAAGGGTLVVFCHFDGAVWFFDLRTLTETGVVRAAQPNPFWLSPIFTPDGQLLYLHQQPGFGDTMQVVDLAARKLRGPVPTPTDLEGPGPFSWLFPVAYAGGVASTVPISPDGLTLYSGTHDGIVALRIPDLKPVAKLAAGVDVGEVWVSGDGRTLYATTADNRGFVVVGPDGTATRVPFTGFIGGFIAAEHG